MNGGEFMKVSMSTTADVLVNQPGKAKVIFIDCEVGACCTGPWRQLHPTPEAAEESNSAFAEKYDKSATFEFTPSRSSVQYHYYLGLMTPRRSITRTAQVQLTKLIEEMKRVEESSKLTAAEFGTLAHKLAELPPEASVYEGEPRSRKAQWKQERNRFHNIKQGRKSR